MIWGQTGTRKGATHLQIASVGWLWSRYPITELHTGDCIGVDEQLYHLGRAFGAHIEIHPPRNYKYRAFVGDHLDHWWQEQTYTQRDQEIVHEGDALVGCPRGIKEEFSHSGTWNTIRYARSLQRPIAIVWPNGHISYEHWTLERVT